mgnify:CR=1 FL=1
MKGVHLKRSKVVTITIAIKLGKQKVPNEEPVATSHTSYVSYS